MSDVRPCQDCTAATGMDIRTSRNAKDVACAPENTFGPVAVVSPKPLSGYGTLLSARNPWPEICD